LQRLIPKGEQRSLQTHIATTERMKGYMPRYSAGFLLDGCFQLVDSLANSPAHASITSTRSRTVLNMFVSVMVSGQ
jgi:hypothetical protein